MHLPLYIAKRYLFARKSHNVINVISAISAIGMAIGTAAIVIILSVYNGFDGLVRQMRSSIEPDILIRPSQGKVFVPDSAMLESVKADLLVAGVYEVLQEKLYLAYDEKGMAVTAKGVDAGYEHESPVAGHITDGRFALHNDQVPLAVTGSGVAATLGISPRFLSAMELYFPSRTKPFSMANPSSSLVSVKVWPSGVFVVNDDLDKDLVIIPLETMRDLLGYRGGEVSALEVRLAPGSGERDLRRVTASLSRSLGEDFQVLDRQRQNVALYRMMRYEKASIWLILMFVVIVMAFNVFGSLSMLMIEKEDDTRTLSALGATGGTIRKIFIYEGWMVSLLGMLAGMAAGVVLTLLQQKFGLVSMPASWTHDPYPVALKASDLLITALSVGLIGYLTALFPVIRKIGKK